MEPVGELTTDPEAMRAALLIQGEPVLWEQLQAHVGDFFGRFTCEAVKVTWVLEVAPLTGSSAAWGHDRPTQPNHAVGIRGHG